MWQRIDVGLANDAWARQADGVGRGIEIGTWCRTMRVLQAVKCARRINPDFAGVTWHWRSSPLDESDQRIIKGPEAVVLDDVARGTRELLEVYRLLGADLEDEGLRARLDRHHAELSAALARFIAARQGEGELPEAGDSERAQWRSLGLRIKGILSEEAKAGILAREAATESRALTEQIQAAREQHPAPAVLEVLTELAELLGEQAETLEAAARQG